MPRPQQHHAAAALADRRLDQRDLAAPDHLDVDPLDEPRRVPHEHPHGPARRDVDGHGEPEGRDRHGYDELELLLAPRPQAFAVTPGGELEAPRLAHTD